MTLTTINNTLNSQATTIKETQIARVSTVKEAINLAIKYGNDNKLEFSTKRNAIAAYTKTVLNDEAANVYFTRAIKIAKSHLVDGYKAKFELLTIAQIEQLFCFNKNVVNKLMALHDDEYIDSVKELIKTAKVQKSTRVFSKAVAKLK